MLPSPFAHRKSSVRCLVGAGLLACAAEAGGVSTFAWRGHTCDPFAAPERLTDDAALDARPAWSPDGRALAFESMREDGTPNLWRLDLDDNRITRLTRMPGGARMPAWAPTGGAR